jgi:DNA-binding CsgD family transcriptional regulator
MPRPASPAPPVEPPELELLTRREREILRLVAEGRSNDEVARLLWVSRQTVKFHLSSVYRKLGVANRTGAGRWAYAHGLLAADAAALAA